MPDKTSAWDQLSGETAQVLFCDLQSQIVKHSKTNSPRALASSAGALCQLAKLFSLPTIISLVPEGKNAPQFIAELNDKCGSAPQILRSTASLFDDKATFETIAHSGRKVRIVAGFMVEAVVLATALDALAQGYLVVGHIGTRNACPLELSADQQSCFWRQRLAVSSHGCCSSN